jgi:hypothetical protein
MQALTTQTTAGHHWAATHQPMTIDDCVRLVTCFDSFDELKQTLPTYAPKFYGKPATTDEANAQRRVVAAFNAYAEREGRPSRAFIAGAAQ